MSEATKNALTSNARNLPELLRDAETRLNAHVFHKEGDSALVSIPANRDRDVDLLLMEADAEIERLTRELQDSTDIIRGQSADIIRLRAALYELERAVSAHFAREFLFPKAGSVRPELRDVYANVLIAREVFAGTNAHRRNPEPDSGSETNAERHCSPFGHEGGNPCCPEATVTTSKSESGWLIESCSTEPTYWRAPGDWCSNPNHATRFARQMDADMVASTIKSMTPIRTMEHQWG